MTLGEKRKESVLSKRTTELFSKEGSSYLPSEIGDFYYSYDQLDKNLGRELKNVTLQVRTLYGQTLANAIKIGKYLDHVQKNVLGHGEWINWLIKEFEEPGYFTHHTGRNFVNCYYISLEFGGLEHLKPMTLSTLYNIGRKGVPKSAKEEVVNRCQAGEKLNKKQVQAIISSHKRENMSRANKVTQSSDQLTIDVNNESESEDAKSSINVPILDFDTETDLKDRIESSNLKPGNVIGVKLTTPVNYPYVIDLCKEMGLTYYWNIIVLRKNSYSQDFVFQSSYDSVLVFYMGHIDQPLDRLRDVNRSHQEVQKELDKLSVG